MVELLLNYLPKYNGQKEVIKLGHFLLAFGLRRAVGRAAWAGYAAAWAVMRWRDQLYGCVSGYAAAWMVMRLR